MNLDTYYDTHPNNPANQPEPESIVTYEVVLYDERDSVDVCLAFETLEQAVQRFNEIAYGTEFDWIEITIWKITDGQRECIKSALSSTLFLEMKRTLARIREIESFPMDATSDEQQELVELKRKLYGNS